MGGLERTPSYFLGGKKKMEKYTVELTSEEGVLIAYLIEKSTSNLKGEITLSERGLRDDLYEKIHPANHPERKE